MSPNVYLSVLHEDVFDDGIDSAASVRLRIASLPMPQVVSGARILSSSKIGVGRVSGAAMKGAQGDN